MPHKYLLSFKKKDFRIYILHTSLNCCVPMIIQSLPITVILLDKSKMFSIKHVPDITGVHKLLTKKHALAAFIGPRAITLGNELHELA